MERNIIIDYFKIFLSFLVILIHLDPLMMGSEVTCLVRSEISDGVARIAVPCFFVINGYFISRKINNWKSVVKQVKRLSIVYFVWVFIYVSFFSTIGTLNIRPDITRNLLIRIIIFGFDHLWYIHSLILGLILLYILGAKTSLLKKYSTQILIVLVLFLGGYLIQQENINSVIRNLGYYRNALFFALPFLILGKMIRENEHILVKIRLWIILVVIVIGLGTLLSECYLVLEKGYLFIDIYLSLVFLCPFIIILVLKYSKYKYCEDEYISLLPFAVYIVHLMPIYLLSFLPSGQNNIFTIPFLLLLTLLISHGVITMNKRIKIFL